MSPIPFRVVVLAIYSGMCNATVSATVHKFGVMVICLANIPDTLKALKAARTKVKEVLQKAKGNCQAHNPKVVEMHALLGDVTTE
eukprot:14296998-Ditylum_brightwellii.AAC.1